MKVNVIAAMRLHRKNQAHKTLGTYRKCFHYAVSYDFPSQENYSMAKTSWQVEIDKEVEVCIYLGLRKRPKMAL